MLLRLLLPAILLVRCLMAAPVPAPEQFFGHKIGADRTVLDWDRVVAYFRSLENGSPAVRVSELGKSTEGRPFIAVIIAAPETLRNLDRYRDIQERLADPRRTPRTEAEQFVTQGKAVVMITCSIHSTELASTHTAVEFAYRLVTEKNPKFDAILRGTILILVPSLNPDGLDLVTRWYRRTAGTPFEGAEPPGLYHKYVGHDNNRDWYIFSQQETRLTVSQLHNVWHPQIVYDVHQQGPYASRMFVPPWMDPIDPNIDPIIVAECNSFGAGMAADLTAAGKTGIAINAMYDFWTPARHYQAYHGGLRILTESASARLASPITVRPEQIARAAIGYNPREASWNHLEPWLGGEWRLRDIIDYQEIAWESLLFQAAVRREDLLRNFYSIGLRAVSRREPYAFVIPARQPDPGAARKLLETLAFGQVEIERAAGAFQAGGRQYAAGSHVIRLAQPYGSFAKTLLERQNYPDLLQYPGGPPRRPYDVTAHTLPLLMGVDVDLIQTPFTARLVRVDRFEAPVEQPAVLPAADTDSWRAVNRIWKTGASVWRDPRTGDFHRSAAGGAGLVELRRPRLGLYKSFVPSIDEGWTRWLLEQFGFEYASVANAEIRAGGLRRRFDVLIVPDQSDSSIENGYRAGSMPAEFCGGLGDEGAEGLRQFVTEGGTLIFLNGSAGYAVRRLGLKLNNVVRGVPASEFYSPGSLLNAVLDTRHPLALGLPREIAIWNDASPAWEIPEGAPASAVAAYPASAVLASGWLLGEKFLAEKAALVDYRLGAGHVVLFGMSPQYRAQSYRTFKLLFNAFLPL
jgi:hypothetical protein